MHRVLIILGLVSITKLKLSPVFVGGSIVLLLQIIWESNLKLLINLNISTIEK